MITNIRPLLDRYLRLCPNEAEDLRLLSEQLDHPEDITSRKNFVGHVTVSAFIINENSKQVLMLEHKSLAKLLQPGGHIDQEDDSFLETTLREIQQETGLKPRELSLRAAVPQSPEMPFDIDTHSIPENIKKAEPGHYHHDFRYLYTTKRNTVEIDPNESNNYKWVDWEDFIEVSSFMDIADKISSILEPNVREFFRSLADKNSKKASVVAVSHLIPSSEDYIKSLQENFNLIGIIPKPKSINMTTRRRLDSEGVAILDQFSRDSISENPDIFIEFLSPFDNICLIDIGGYFSESMSQFKEKLGDKLLGVIEDTENGHQKYEEHLPANYKVMSVARSPLKNFEDQLVGQGVAHATETVLRQVNTLITYKNCGIIGYGKIGRGIADYLQQRGIKPRVSEINAMRSIQASCDGTIVCSTDELIRKSDVIFCATGMRALDILKLRDLKKGAYLASVTSSDDEFDLKYVDSEYEKQAIAEHITRYVKRGHSFHLLNDGNAINFLFSAAVDKYINLVQGELIFSISKILKDNSKNNDSKQIAVNVSEDHEYIARMWLDYVLRENQLG